MFFHGLPKFQGGTETLTKVGSAMGNLGLNFAPTFWGFMAALTETGGGILLILGFFFRPATAALTFTMIVAATMHFKLGQGLSVATHPLELACVFIGLFLIGPGRFSIDKS